MCSAIVLMAVFLPLAAGAAVLAATNDATKAKVAGVIALGLA